MKLEFGYLFGMALQTIFEPRKIARELFELHVPRPVLWQIFALMVVVSTMLGALSVLLFPPPPGTQLGALASPLLAGLMEAGLFAAAAWAIWRIGRAFGGLGSFDQALMSIVWLQWVLFWVQIAVLGLALFAPGLAVMLYVFGVFLSFWIPANFIAEMHGFRSVGAVIGVMVATLIIAAFLVSFVLALLGVGPQDLGINNV